jgi:hypothetical protein
VDLTAELKVDREQGGGVGMAACCWNQPISSSAATGRLTWESWTASQPSASSSLQGGPRVFDALGHHPQTQLRPRSTVERTITASLVLLVICDTNERSTLSSWTGRFFT